MGGKDRMSEVWRFGGDDALDPAKAGELYISVTVITTVDAALGPSRLRI
jgi:hypothetical protein